MMKPTALLGKRENEFADPLFLTFVIFWLRGQV